MTPDIFSKLLSRKFGLAAAIVLLIVFVELPLENIVALTIIASAYILAEGATDYARARKVPNNGH